MPVSQNTTGQQNTFVGEIAGFSTTTAAGNSFLGRNAGSATTTGGNNTFVGKDAGSINNTGLSNTFLGQSAGGSNITGSNNTLIGKSADVTSPSLTFATAIGSNAVVLASNRIQLGRSGSDTVSVGLLGTATATQLCVNGAVLASCTSSRRYKENIMPFQPGLSLVKRLQPVTFHWREQKVRDLGLIAEEVASVEPLLVTHNEKGEIQGVKYDQITVALINAVKEQQAQIENDRKRIERQDADIAALKALACARNRRAPVCRSQK